MPQKATVKPGIYEVVTVLEAAKALKVSDDTVRRLIAAGDLDYCDIAPSTSKRPKFRVPVESLRRFIQGRSTNAGDRRTA